MGLTRRGNRPPPPGIAASLPDFLDARNTGR